MKKTAMRELYEDLMVNKRKPKTWDYYLKKERKQIMQANKDGVDSVLNGTTIGEKEYYEKNYIDKSYLEF